MSGRPRERENTAPDGSYQVRFDTCSLATGQTPWIQGLASPFYNYRDGFGISRSLPLVGGRPRWGRKWGQRG